MSTESKLPKQDGSIIPVAPDSSRDDGLRSVTRLVVGAIGVGVEELRLRLRIWEDEIDLTNAKKVATSSQTQPEGFAEQSAESVTQSDELLRYALIGMIFDAQEIVKRGSVKVVKVGRRVQRRTSPVLRPLASSRLLSPARRRYKKILSRGQRKVDQWIAIGRAEESHSKMLAETAFSGSVDETIDYLAENPAIQSLIQTQTTGLADEIIEEARERAVAADIVLEGLCRALFRRKPRHTLPPPPPEVQLSAVTLLSSRTTINAIKKV